MRPDTRFSTYCTVNVQPRPKARNPAPALSFSGLKENQRAFKAPVTMPENSLLARFLARIKTMLSALKELLGLQKIRKIDRTANASPATLEAHVCKLAGINRCFENPAGLDEAAEYVKQQWEQMGLSVQEQVFTVKGNRYRNLMVSLGPQEAERLIVGAHYDVCAHEDASPQHACCTAGEFLAARRQGNFQKGRQRNDMPGADDNASGVAGLLELSRLLKKREKDLNKRIDLVAFTLEEPPNFATSNMGSAQHARSIFAEETQAGRTIPGMIALEMIGYFKDEPGTQKYPDQPLPLLKSIYGNRGNFISVVGDLNSLGWVRQVHRTMKQNTTLPVRWLSAPNAVPGIDFSDHRNYAKLGIPAVMVTDTAYYRNPHYHQHTDLPETLDYGRMAEVVHGVLGTVLNVGSQTD